MLYVGIFFVGAIIGWLVTTAIVRPRMDFVHVVVNESGDTIGAYANYDGAISCASEQDSACYVNRVRINSQQVGETFTIEPVEVL